MRPPHYTGEDRDQRGGRPGHEPASMRPPHYTGEDRWPPLWRNRRRWRFNEAPALHGGRHPT